MLVNIHFIKRNTLNFFLYWNLLLDNFFFLYFFLLYLFIFGCLLVFFVFLDKVEQVRDVSCTWLCFRTVSLYIINTLTQINIIVETHVCQQNRRTNFNSILTMQIQALELLILYHVVNEMCAAHKFLLVTLL